MGRPRIYETPEELEQAVEGYFESGNKITITGLAYHLGFCDRQSLYDYEDKPGFSCIIKQARLRVEMAYEERLTENNVTGAIFALKNMGWKDKTEHGFTDGQGKDVSPVTIYQIPDNGRSKSGQAAEGLPGEST